MGVEGFPSASFFLFFFFRHFHLPAISNLFYLPRKLYRNVFFMRQYASLSFGSASPVPNKKDPDVRLLVISIFINELEVKTALFFSVLDSVFKGLK